MGGEEAQLKGATQFKPTNRLTIATWLRPTGTGPPLAPMPCWKWAQAPVDVTGAPKQAATTLKVRKS